jgi:hypothetical protein
VGGPDETAGYLKKIESVIEEELSAAGIEIVDIEYRR